MADYQFATVEEFARQKWKAFQSNKTTENSDKPKYYVLDMFPYPSGAGLHVGHPLGYIASDIVSRYKRQKGFNVLHPMGFDAFGLPAEQYAIQTGQHPAITTAANIVRYREQMDAIGLSYDWDRKIETSDPAYYRWTQWIFLQLFDSWYDKKEDKARPIADLIAHFEKFGNYKLSAQCDEETAAFDAASWNSAPAQEQARILMQYRLAYQAEARVNWCPALGTVLANDEVKDGVSERGGHPVEIRMMKQWMMRISAYSQRLLDGLMELDWSDAIKEQQKNWIGRSAGAMIQFRLKDHAENIQVFTTRPDTLFGVSFMVLAPEHELVTKICTDEQRSAVEAYTIKAKNRSERDRMADVKSVSGVFTGAYALHPFTQKPIPVWIADYVLAGYGTGAVMAVPGGDERDWRFAQHFGLPIPDVLAGSDLSTAANSNKETTLINSDFLNGLPVKDAIVKAIAEIERKGIGQGKIQYRLRDAIFSRQRYWGEPLPIYFDQGVAKALPESALPLVLPEVDKYLPTENGEPPLARAQHWEYNGHPLETTTMPGWAGSSWYFLRYMDPDNQHFLADPAKIKYWQQVDLYMGGAEHATGHLLYARFWTHFLHDIGLVSFREPFKKLVNQGMIQGQSKFVYRVEGQHQTFVSASLKNDYTTTALHVDVNLVKHDRLDIEGFKNWREEYRHARFILEDPETGIAAENGIYICGTEVEKMSKSKWNVVNPDDIIAQYGADTLRLYEMFLGPLEDAKPWDTHGIEGVYRFLNKLWRLFHQSPIDESEATEAELKILHQTIKKIEDGIERFAFNTCVSAFMICVNELQALKSNKRAILSPLTQLLAPFAPFIAEHLWSKLGNENCLAATVGFPVFMQQYVEDDHYDYPVQENGKMRFTINMPKKGEKAALESLALANEKVKALLVGKTLKKLVVVPGRIVNLVVGA
jgi:leucyl-tRNA synthetase